MALKVGYFLKEATTNLRRNRLMTVAAILTAAVSLLLLGGVLTLGDFVQSITRQIEGEVEVSVFLRDDVTADQEADVGSVLDTAEFVRATQYVSKEEAYEEFKELFRDQPTLTENVDPEVLPPSYRVGLTDPAHAPLVASRFGCNDAGLECRHPAVLEVADHREVVQRLVGFTSLLRNFSVVMVAVLLGAAVLLIANTTQLAIYARRKEVQIMKLVGATNWFVRLPFMVEGIVAGIGGATIALVLLGAGKSVARSQLPVWIPTVALHGVALGQVFWLVLLGVGVGALGSAVAMRRFLEV